MQYFVESSSIMSSYYFLQRYIDTPVGCLRLVASNTALYAVLWHDEKMASSLQRILAGRVWENAHSCVATNLHGAEQILLQTEMELNQYFQGERQQFTLPIFLNQTTCIWAEQIGTPLQRQIWQQLQTIEYGKTVSYLQFARLLGREKAVRAVSTAIGKNPLSIVLPCHRVIGSNGHLTGFAGGLQNKQKLLMLEQSDFTLL